MDNNIYDGIGVLDYNKVKTQCKKVDSIIVNIEYRENINGETEYSFLKGIIIPFNVLEFLNRKSI